MKAKLLLLALTLSILFSNAQTALNFDGINNYVVGPNNSSLDLYHATIEGWIKTTNAGTGYRGIIVKVYNFGIYLENNNLMIFENGTGRRIFTDPKINLADGIWHHIALSFNHMETDGSKLYVDACTQ